MTPEAFYGLVPREELRAAVAAAGTPAYLLFGRIVERRLAALRACLGPRGAVHFAVKANPHPSLLHFLATRGAGFDVASGGELERVLRAGARPERVEMTGPGKGEEELRAALRAGVGAVNVESLSELDLLARLATPQAPASIGLRVNVRRGGAGGLRMGPDTHLGLREEELPEACGRVRASGGRLRLTGLHFHRGSQVLDPAAIADHFGTALELAAAVHREHHPIGKVNFGGGWGVDYWDGQAPLDLVDLAGRLAPIFDGPAARALPADCRWIVEPGRFLVAEAGIFAVSIRHAKQGYERHFAVADGGIHHCHMLSGGLGQVLRRDFRHEIWPAQPPAPGAAPCDASLAGPLCLPHDLLLQRAAWPGGPPRAGDRVVFFNCGAYGLTASPSQFLGHPPPRELLL